MSIGRAHPVGILLASGKPLITGGWTCCPYSDVGRETTELYDPKAGTWSTTGSTSIPQSFTTAAVMSDGRVLLAGGATGTVQPNLYSTAKSELYNPTDGAWSLASRMATARSSFAQSRLLDGRVLVAGGWDNSFGLPGTFLRSAELYNPATGVWSSAGRTSSAHLNVPPGALLGDGRTLVEGGTVDNSGAVTAVAELFTPPPGLAISPAAGPVGITAAASGVAFRSSKRITLTFNGIPLRTPCATDGDGDFAACTFTVHGVPVGRYLVTASDGVDFADTSFTVTP